MEKYEIIQATTSLKKQVEDINHVIHYDDLLKKRDEYDIIMSSPSFWDDQAKAKSILQDANIIKDRIAKYENLKEKVDDLEMVLELNDESLFDQAEKLITSTTKEVNDFEIELLLNEKYDHNYAIMELHPGAGGTESQDWTLMLYRMYMRYCEKKGYEVELEEYEEALDAGLKSVTFIIKAINAYGYFKSEKGVHRLIRISPFDANSRRHTSFVAVNVYPLFDNDNDIVINPNDIRIDTYRSSGAGGQHINKTDSAVRITHLPTGIVVNCQNQRSQIQNKEAAMNILKSKLFDYNANIQSQELKTYSGDVTDNAFGNQIRTYTLQPYTLVKDHRTNAENGNAMAVLDGELDLFITSYLQKRKSEE